MDGIEGLLARDFGVRPQGKAAPMAAPRAAGSVWPNPRSTSTPSAAPSYDDLFGAPAAPASASSPDSLLESFKGRTASSAAAKTKPTPAPAYDENIFEAFSGLRSSHSPSSTARYDGGDVFGAAAPAYDDMFAGNRSAPPSYDDLLGGFGGKPQAEERKRSAVAEEDDLLGGFGRKPQAEEKKKPVVVEEDDLLGGQPQAEDRKRTVVAEEDDLLGGFGRRPQAEEEKKPVVAEEDQGDMGFDDLIPGFAGSSPPRSRKTNDDNKKRPAVPTSESIASTGRFTDPLEDLDKSANSEGKNVDSTADNDSDSSAFDQVPKSDPLFTAEINGGTKDSHQPSKARDSSPVQSSRNRNPARRSSMEDFGNTMPKSHSARYSDIHVDDSVPSSERYSGNAMEDQSPTSTESEDGIWLTVSEIPLLTRPTSAPPPSRSPPLLKQKPLGAKANGKPQMPTYDNNVFDDDEEFERNTSDREEKERRERLEQAREMRLREEKEREKIRLEKERELKRQRERERERQAVERATKEARERAAAEARAKAEGEAHQRAQRAAVQRAQKEVRERAAAEAKERAARAAAEERERAAAEEKERAAAEAKERERAAAERAAAERVQQEARKRAERAAVERAAGEARERQAAAAAAAATREKQSTADDLESFFGVNAQANSAPKQRSPTVDSMFDPQPQGRGTVNGSQRAASTSASTRKAPSATNFGNDLFDIFGASASSEVFQEVEGESEERRCARLERHQRTCERAAKALAEKNERDMQVQREQVERDRIAGTLDFEIKRWAAGKEGNLRALLSTLQYILWPECGWQAVSLTDLITGAAVKKQYRKATLCIHPDKVQQKGATLQQKYIAEKVFDILKEAWNKFNSEELF